MTEPKYQVIKCDQTKQFFPVKKLTCERNGSYFELYYNIVEFFNGTYQAPVSFPNGREAREYLEERKRKDYPYTVVTEDV